jgi:hypothetical protein
MKRASATGAPRIEQRATIPGRKRESFWSRRIVTGKERNSFFALDQVEGRALRSDAEFMRMKISVPEVAAADGHPAVASVFFENGGDSSVLLDRLEVTSAKGELRPVSGAMVPVRVPAGGLKEIYRFPLTLSRGETETRQFVVADRDGDSWGATLRLVPCEN